jgi:hypothetical protein
MHPEVEPYLTRVDEPLRRTGLMRAKTGGYTSCGVALWGAVESHRGAR